jgi:hypothetical protein
MDEQPPWVLLGISEDRFYTEDAISFWKTKSIGHLWQNIVNVGGNYLVNVKTSLHILNRKANFGSISINDEISGEDYLKTIVGRIDKIEEMFKLMSKRLELENDDSELDIG